MSVTAPFFTSFLKNEISKTLALLSRPDTWMYKRTTERYRRIAVSAFSNIVSKFVFSLVSLISVAITVNYLGKEQFGLWMVVSSLVVWLQIIDFGIGNGLTNALSEAYGNDDRTSATAYINTAIVTHVGVSTLLLPFFFSLSHYLPWSLVLDINDPGMSKLAAKCFTVAGVILIIGLPLACLSRVFAAFQMGYINSITQTIGSLISLVCIVLAIKLQLGLPYLVLSTSLAPIFSSLLSWPVVPKIFPWYSFSLRSVGSHALRRIAITSIPILALQIGALLINQLVNVLLAHLGSLTLVADYNVLMRIYMLFFMTGSCIVLPFFPAIREAFERRERNWVRGAVFRALFFRTFTIVIPCCFLPFWGNWLILIWIKEPLDNPFGWFGWTFLSICMLLSSFSSTLGEILTHLDVIKSQLKIIFIAATVALTGMYTLVPSQGLSGIFLSTPIFAEL